MNRVNVVVLNSGRILLPRDIRQYLEAVLVITTRVGATGVLWVEAKDDAKPATIPRTASHSKESSSPVNSVEGKKSSFEIRDEG